MFSILGVGWIYVYYEQLAIVVTWPHCAPSSHAHRQNPGHAPHIPTPKEEASSLTKQKLVLFSLREIIITTNVFQNIGFIEAELLLDF